tara:strand:- start:2519 stop:3043 length:525 start_codon:yes stop_codon:yes gene_type:complete
MVDKLGKHDRQEMFRFGMWSWDIQYLQDRYEQFRTDADVPELGALVNIPVKEWHEMFLGKTDDDALGALFIHIDIEHAKTVDMTQPLMMVTITGEADQYGFETDQKPMSLLIDGWHRLHRGYMEGLETMPAIHLNKDVEADARMWVSEVQPDPDTGKDRVYLFPRKQAVALGGL